MVFGLQMFGQHFCVSMLPSFLWQHTRKNIIVVRVFACKRLPNILFSDVVISIQFKPTLIPLKFSLGCRGFGRHFDPDGSSVFLSSTVRTGARSRPRKWKWCAFQGHVPRACHKKEPRAGGGRPTKLTCKPFDGGKREKRHTKYQSAFLVKQKCSARGRTSERLGANPGEAVARSNCRGKSAGRLRRPISVDSRNRAMAPRFC